MSNHRHVILNHVDSPLKFLLWTAGEMGMLIAPALIGLFADELMMGLAISGLNFMVNRSYKKRFGKGQLESVLYWYLPSGFLKKIPASCICEYLG